MQLVCHSKITGTPFSPVLNFKHTYLLSHRASALNQPLVALIIPHPRLVTAEEQPMYMYLGKKIEMYKFYEKFSVQIPAILLAFLAWNVPFILGRNFIYLLKKKICIRLRSNGINDICVYIWDMFLSNAWLERAWNFFKECLK